MENILKYFVKGLTLLTFMAMSVLTFVALTLGPQWGMFFICLLLTLGTGVFVYADIKSIIAKFEND